jgi:hypothetical protein
VVGASCDSYEDRPALLMAAARWDRAVQSFGAIVSMLTATDCPRRGTHEDPPSRRVERRRRSEGRRRLHHVSPDPSPMVAARTVVRLGTRTGIGGIACGPGFSRTGVIRFALHTSRFGRASIGLANKTGPRSKSAGTICPTQARPQYSRVRQKTTTRMTLTPPHGRWRSRSASFPTPSCRSGAAVPSRKQHDLTHDAGAREARAVEYEMCERSRQVPWGDGVESTGEETPLNLRRA